MKRVRPFGVGKTIIIIKIDELPDDIRDGIMERCKGYIDNDATEIVIACEAIIGRKGE